MTNQQILEKAIKKAVKNGWNEECVIDLSFRKYYAIIFGHDFAKALFGTDIIKSKGLDWFMDVPAYKWHLAHMVIADNPIAYLGENI